MLRHILPVGIAAMSLVPAMAIAQPQDHQQSESSCDRQRNTRVVSTVAGAGIGGVLGNVVAGDGDRVLGTVIGAAGGALLGNRLARPAGDCARAYGFYDDNGYWHSSRVGPDHARGYYDREGGWVDGPPNGHYDADNLWIVNTGSTRVDVRHYDQIGWVPASANGYYDRDDRWVAGTTDGRYDANGRWVARSGHGTGDEWLGANRSILGQVSWLEQYLRSPDARGQVRRWEAIRAQRELASIRNRERTMRRDRMGNLSERHQAQLQLRIDRLNRRLGTNGQ